MPIIHKKNYTTSQLAERLKWLTKYFLGTIDYDDVQPEILRYTTPAGERREDEVTAEEYADEVQQIAKLKYSADDDEINEIIVNARVLYFDISQDNIRGYKHNEDNQTVANQLLVTASFSPFESQIAKFRIDDNKRMLEKTIQAVEKKHFLSKHASRREPPNVVPFRVKCG